ncbi:hypothetical protein E2986_06125 [Frieseomelitta varia]|uniref:Secreted protein n=1 Tax=Frieseomelitta varia TaxID=561572 RepID=A0A833RBY3_9HYME|nr:hypothetical protein E2986_06125 [Frieseomelitta varia]
MSLLEFLLTLISLLPLLFVYSDAAVIPEAVGRPRIQKAGVQYILDSVIQALLADPERNFVCLNLLKGLTG